MAMSLVMRVTDGDAKRRVQGQGHGRVQLHAQLRQINNN